MKKRVRRPLILAVIGLIVLTSPLILAAQTAATVKITVRQIFPRNQGYEAKMLQAVGASLTILPETLLGQALGKLSLQAGEIFYSDNNTITADELIANVASYNGEKPRAAINGILGTLIMNTLMKPNTDAQTTALRNWAAELYRSLKVRSAYNVLLEYQKWKADYCQYKAEGYKAPPDCGLGSLNMTEMYAGKTPPQDIITKAGLKTVLGNDAGKIADAIALGAATVTVGAAALALASVTGFTSIAASGAPGFVTITWVSLTAAFGGSTGAALASSTTLTTASTATGALGATGWASVVAAPVAAIILAIVVGTTEGIRVVEATKVEPMLKMKLGAAMTDPINMTNVLDDINSRDMFFMAFMEATQKNFKITPPNVDGEVRFYCQAGYMSKFKISYKENVDRTGYFPKWETKEFTSKDLSVGNEAIFAIPASAKDIRAQGWYLAGTWKPLLDQSIALPTYLCYTSYGTIFDAKYKTDCPEVGSMVTKPNQLTVTQGGAYQGWVYLSYKQNGKVVKVLDLKGIKMGFTTVFPIPKDATQIYLYIRAETGLAWQPWKAAFEKTWPTPPNECIKVYGTTLDPKWNNECK
ncbi:MAG TPA: thiol-activated cytolysin C-terminal domain-containing protein [Chitinophagaceae bacterium]